MGVFWGSLWKRAEFSPPRNLSDGQGEREGQNEGNSVIQEVPLERGCLQGDAVTGQGEMGLK